MTRDHPPGTRDPSRTALERPLRVALAGNPNSGKTSLFNALTGGHHHVGNYAGVTVEKKSGRCRFAGRALELVDLPGTYSLTSYSPEERIAEEELLRGDFDVVVAVVDSTSLKRSLVLVAQLMQLGANPVLCLNMSDEAERGGQRLDRALLSRLLGFPVVATVGHRGLGVVELQQAILHAADDPVTRSRLVLGERLDRALAAIAARLPETARIAPEQRSWVATRLLCDDQAITARVDAGGRAVAAVAEAAAQRSAIVAETGLDASLFVTERYYGFVDGLLREVVTQRSRADARATSDAIDAVLANRVLGLPVFFLVMYLVFWVTFELGDVPVGWLEAGFDWLGSTIGGSWPAATAPHLRSLVIDGLIHGVGGVVVFVPNIVLLFLCLALLEDTGYMARAAFLVDRGMHRFGLHGRSFIPMMTGFGCSIPGIMATRTLENERDRLTTMLVLPLMSCGARLPIWMLLIPAFFPPALRAPALWGIYMVGIALALVLALVLRRSILRGEDAPFVMELPPYRLPTPRAVAMKMVERSWLYLRKAGTIILGISILLWVVTAYPKQQHHAIDAAVDSGQVMVVDSSAHADRDQVAPPTVPAGVRVITPAERDRIRASEDLEHSIAGRIGAALEPVIRPLGFDWKIGTALIGAFAAKEVFVSQMGIVYALGDADQGARNLPATLAHHYSPLVGISLMLFLLIATPCMATLAVTRRESGSWKWALLQFWGLTAVGYLVALLVYQIGSVFS